MQDHQNVILTHSIAEDHCSACGVLMGDINGDGKVSIADITNTITN